jgi:glutamyl-tRNA reductase
VELEETKEHRLAATDQVNLIISEEIAAYNEWLEGAPLRALLAKFKISINNKVKTYFESNTKESNIKLVTNQVMKKVMANNEFSIDSIDLDELISDEIASLNV